MSTKHIEGVPYYRHVVRYRLVDGRRRRLTMWSPGVPWIYNEAAWMLDVTVGVDNIRAGSATIRRCSP